MSNDLIFYQFSRSKVERGDFSHFLNRRVSDKLPGGGRLQERSGWRSMGTNNLDAVRGRRFFPGSANPFSVVVFAVAMWLFRVLPLCGIPLAGTLEAGATSRSIDRFALVTRHNVHFQEPRAENVLTVGNGNFAFTTDLTGLQTFPVFHHQGIPLTTMANWAWHSYPNRKHFALGDVQRPLQVHGKTQFYPVVGFPYEDSNAASQWLNENRHRFSLGQIGLVIRKHDGTEAGIADLKASSQDLDLWTGTVRCRFEIEGVPVQVVTVVHPNLDLVASSIRSDLFRQGRLGVRLRFPYPTHRDDPSDWSQPGRHRTVMEKVSSRWLRVQREADETRYHVLVEAGASFRTRNAGPHEYILTPDSGDGSFDLAAQFAPQPVRKPLPSVQNVQAATQAHWEEFWQSGGVVDFTGSIDPRAAELERRIVLSQYLTAIQSAGLLPPQETGLTLNSWNGKFHLEVHWFHAAHFALWGHPEMLERSLQWYVDFLPQAKKLARSYGQEGARWPQMVGPEGWESPNHINPFLLWQQPSIIYLAELCYRAHPSEETLRKYQSVVSETAQFLASAVHYEQSRNRYILGPPVVPPPELWEIGANNRFIVWKAEDTFNPAFELAYWDFGLRIAQAWRMRLGVGRQPEWDHILGGLSRLPQALHPTTGQPLYLHAENATDLWTNPKRRIQHPSFLMAKGMLPGDMVDDVIMRDTFEAVMAKWDREQMWGTDFPLLAMTATRLGLPKLAVDCLFLPGQNNNFGPNGHSVQWHSYPVYLPSNGSLLAAVALMTAGYDGCQEPLPGFPKDGSWKVRFEGIPPLP